MGSIFLESENFDFEENDDLGEFFANSRARVAEQKNTGENIAQKKDTTENQRSTLINTSKNTEEGFVKNTRVTSKKSDVTENFSSLSALIGSMKTSFLAREESENTIRQVLIANTETSPLMLLRKGDTTVLIGTGFSEVESAGNIYKTFADMRLAYSEKTRLQGWILTDGGICPERFTAILELLDFPIIYATREIIAELREKISEPKTLEKIRFFELFAEESASRLIGNIEFFAAEKNGKNLLALKSEDEIIAYEAYTIAEKNLVSTLMTTLVSRAEKNWKIGDTDFVEWEIVAILGKNIEKKSMKFSFDTFYQDKKSFGTIAGYTLSDRKNLSESGVLIFTLEEDMRARTIAGHIFIDSRGFVQSYEMMKVHKEVIKSIRVLYENLVAENPHIERGELVQTLRREVQKICFVLTGRTPLIMPIIIEQKPHM